MKGIAIVGAVLAMAGAARADEWVTVPYLAAHGMAIDVSSIQHIGNRAVFWELFVQKDAQFGDRLPHHFMAKIDMDCAESNYVMVNFTDYDFKGVVIATKEMTREQHSIMPESLSSLTYNIVCKNDISALRPTPKGSISTANFLLLALGVSPDKVANGMVNALVPDKKY